MKVKKYTGKNLQEIYQEIKLEMGRDAVILHTKKQKKGGILGFFAKEYFDITAAVEESNYSDEPIIESGVNQENEKTRILNRQIAISVQKDSTLNQQLEQKEAYLEKDIPGELKEMQEKMEEIKTMIEGANLNFKGDIKKYYDHLLEQEVDPKLAVRLIKKVEKKFYDEENKDSIPTLLKEEIFKIIKKAKPIDLSSKNKQNVAALVGPTGVGKTTTIAKLAANYTISDKKNVSLVTVDTYRIAAIEQLKTVGEIIGVPVEVVFSPQNLRNTISEQKDKDIVFIDTAGRSHKNNIQMSEIKGFLEAAAPDDIFLVLSACTKYKDMIDIIDKYSSLNIKKIIFTKLDETSTYGSILNVIDKSKKYLTYFTTGQSVPEDIEIVDQEKFCKLLIGDLISG